jgi:hypothetical protein
MRQSHPASSFEYSRPLHANQEKTGTSTKRKLLMRANLSCQ